MAKFQHLKFTKNTESKSSYGYLYALPQINKGESMYASRIDSILKYKKSINNYKLS